MLSVSGSTIFMHSSANSMKSGSNIANFIALRAFSDESTARRNSRRCWFRKRSFSVSLFPTKRQKKTISIFLKLHFQTHKPNWASFSGSTVSSVVNWSIFGLQTWNIFSSGLSLAGSQFAFLCFLKHSKEQLKDQKITINWFFQEGEFLDDLHNNHIPIVFTSWTFIFFRCFFTFWTLHFSILFVRSIKETKPKQCANTCQNWHVTSILVLVL